MELLERYLSAVSILLPQAQRADITAELRDVLLTRREEKEATLGRPLNRDEEVALLKAFGHPLRVAGRYAPRQYLVGPELYPVYSFAVKVLLAIIACSAIIAGVVNATVTPGQPGPAIVKALGVLWTGSIASIGAVTIVFALMERYHLPLRVLDDWNPRDLPAKPTVRRKTWLDSVAAIIVQTVFLLWWAGAITWQSYIPLKSGETLSLEPAEIWSTLYWPVIGLSAGVIGVHVLRLMGEEYRKSALGLSVAVQAGTLIVAALALRAETWVMVSGDGVPAKALRSVDFGINLGIHITLGIVAAVAVFTIAYDLWRLHRGRDVG